MTVPGQWGAFDQEFLEELCDWIGGRKVLEVFAGNGLLASRLSASGVDILATSLFSGHDGHNLGMFHPVVEMSAADAVIAHGAERDVLLMSWPPATEAALYAVAKWGEDKPIVFLGEITDLEQGFGGLGGCASDLFFECTAQTHEFGKYAPRNGLEKAVVLRFDQPRLREALQQHDKSGFGVRGSFG